MQFPLPAVVVPVGGSAVSLSFPGAADKIRRAITGSPFRRCPNAVVPVGIGGSCYSICARFVVNARGQSLLGEVEPAVFLVFEGVQRALPTFVVTVPALDARLVNH